MFQGMILEKWWFLFLVDLEDLEKDYLYQSFNLTLKERKNYSKGFILISMNIIVINILFSFSHCQEGNIILLIGISYCTELCLRERYNPISPYFNKYWESESFFPILQRYWRIISEDLSKKVVILVDEYDKPLIDTMCVNGEQ